MSGARQSHWQSVYASKSETQTSWYRPHLDHSLRLVDGLALPPDAPLIDVGGGRATLVDDLLARGYRDVSVLDLAAVALDAARQRLGADAAQVRWLCANILDVDLPAAHYALWHDRAVFHFLTEPAPRAAYLAQMARALRPGGYAIIATFAADGPGRCSGLPVQRYAADALAACFAAHFECVCDSREEHRTAAGAVQPFTYVLLRKRSDAPVISESVPC
ncbi:MAG: class I SAM-dependent methyltransferase [Proteobacteria bacterium]|nr:class I SAM-dependent methyltransferase [Pseudomonadota bacterium]